MLINLNYCRCLFALQPEHLGISKKKEICVGYGTCRKLRKFGMRANISIKDLFRRWLPGELASST